MGGIIGDAFIIAFVVLVLLTVTVPLWYNVIVRKISTISAEIERVKEQQEQSAFRASQQKRQQEIDLNASIAAAEKARVEAEAKAKVDIANASAAAEVARVKAQQEAEAIRIRGEAEAASLRAQAQAVTPALVDLERARKWNGQGPTTIMGGDPQIINQVPLR